MKSSPGVTQTMRNWSDSSQRHPGETRSVDNHTDRAGEEKRRVVVGATVVAAG